MNAKLCLKFMAATSFIFAMIVNIDAENNDKLVYTAEYSEATPVLDGDINADKAWKNISWSSGFVKHGVSGKPVGNSHFKALYTTEGIYFAVECSEPEMDKIHDEKQGMFWTHDEVELFLLVKPRDGEEEKTHLHLSARGAKNDEFAALTRERTNFKTGWGGNSRLGEKAWTAEFFVPFYLIGIIPEKELGVPANLCRNASPRKELSSWSFQEGSFYNVAGFGVLKLASAPPAVIPAMNKSVITPHFFSVSYRFGELKNDLDLLQSTVGRGLIEKLERSLVESRTPAEQAAALADFNRLEQLYMELRQQHKAAAEKLIFSEDK